MDEAMHQIDTYVLDNDYYFARFLDQLSHMTAQPPEEIVKYLTLFLVLFLLFSSQAHLICNLLLIVIPFFMTHIFLRERPNRDNLLIYWASFSILTLFDRVCDSFPLYYIVKMSLLGLLFLRPIRLVNPIKRFLWTCNQSSFSISATDNSTRSSVRE